MTTKICLGTAQFGLNYGLTNPNGQISELIVSAILSKAAQSGISWLDTAQAYGEAEEVLGRNLHSQNSFHLISKLKAQPHVFFSRDDVAEFEQQFLTSCDRLGRKQLDALLLHSPLDLKKPGSDYLTGWLISLRERGLVNRLGLSIYTKEDLDGVDPALLDIVQLPISLFDQRLLIDGTIDTLISRGVAIHARSIYLQGLILTPSQHWPDWVSNKARCHQRKLEDIALQKDCGLIELAVGFIKSLQDIELVIVGLSGLNDLDGLLKAWSANNPWKPGEWRIAAIQEPSIVDPRNWPR